MAKQEAINMYYCRDHYGDDAFMMYANNQKDCDRRLDVLEKEIKTKSPMITEGDNIKLTKSYDETIAINVRLSNKYDYKSKHIDEELQPKKGNTLDEVTEKLAKAISENSDAIDGETIDGDSLINDNGFI